MILLLAQLTFGGLPCAVDCSGHRAGYEWARKNAVSDPAECREPRSPSFEEGCLLYIDDPGRDPERDDDGNPVPG